MSLELSVNDVPGLNPANCQRPTANPFRATLTRLRRNAMTALETPTTSKYPDVRNYIAGQFVDGNGARTLEVTNPADGSVISRVPLSGSAEIDRAVTAAKKAFPAWSGMPIKERVQVFFRYKTLLEKHIDELSKLVTEENGKIDSEARAEVL